MAEARGIFWHWGRWVCRYRWLVVMAWLGVWGVLWVLAPAWDDITYDGDFAYLPPQMPSAVGQRLLAEAFPGRFARSEVVVVVARRDGPLTENDLVVAYDVARRLKWLHAQALWNRLSRYPSTALTGSNGASGTHDASVEEMAADLEQACQEAAYFDERIYQYERSHPRERRRPPLVDIYRLAASLYDYLGRNEDATRERQRLRVIEQEALRQPPDWQLQLPSQRDWPLVDVWTWREPVMGKKLISPDQQARLVVVRLANEFMAWRNQPLLSVIAGHLEEVRHTLTEEQQQNLIIQWTGSAAIGGDLLLAAKESIRHTEWYTVLLILIILAAVYRAPVMILVPLVAIGLSVSVATHAVALLAVPADRPWEVLDWGLRVFTTTRIFIVVVLFGSGTDYCLFLMSRYREELARWPSRATAMAAAMQGVGIALLTSALTTVVGLAMMGFAEFGKFRFSGPVIGLCLCVTLFVCLSLAPAVIYMLTPFLFWPWSPVPAETASGSRRFVKTFWSRVTRWITHRPGWLLTCSLIPLILIAVYGWQMADHVTYDLLADLPPSRPSRIGTDALRRHFPIGESGPLTLVAYQPTADFSSPDGKKAIYELVTALYQVPKVESIRSLIDPLGEFPPGQTIGLTSSQAWQTLLVRPHRKTSAMFVAETSAYPRNLTRLDIVFQVEPFSAEALETLRQVSAIVQQVSQQRASFWHGSQFAVAGATAAVADLRRVTMNDRYRVQLLVVASVWAVLWATLRRPTACLFLMGSVLLTYYVTLAVTQAAFAFLYGPAHAGLDWKVPLFLFVVLVAVGQDYNVYLVTRVWEEQRQRGPLSGLRHAVIQTGGIITSCGLIMAGTFWAMTSGDWSVWWCALVPSMAGPAPAGSLREIVQLGFALAFGVLLDTLFVRTVLVPAFLSLQSRWHAASPKFASQLPKQKAYLEQA